MTTARLTLRASTSSYALVMFLVGLLLSRCSMVELIESKQTYISLLNPVWPLTALARRTFNWPLSCQFKMAQTHPLWASTGTYHQSQGLLSQPLWAWEQLNTLASFPCHISAIFPGQPSSHIGRCYPDRLYLLLLLTSDDTCACTLWINGFDIIGLCRNWNLCESHCDLW